MGELRVMNRWLVVVGAVLIQMCLGAIYAWSVFTPGLRKIGWTAQETQIVFSVGLVVFALVMVWAGKKLPTWGPRKLAMLSGLVLGAGYLFGGTIGQGTNFWGVLFGVGIIAGAGIGLGYVVPIAVGMRWFPDKKGFITGLAVAGFGFGAMGWVKLAGTWGNLIANQGLAFTFSAYGVAFAALVLLGSVWMVFPPEGWLPKGYVPPEVAKTASGAPKKELPAGFAILNHYQFWMIFLTFAILAGAGLMTIGLMKLYPMQALQDAGMSPEAASATAGTAMAVFFSLANGIGRIVWGTLSDVIGRKRSILIMATTQGFFVIAFTAMAGNEYALYIAAACIGFNFGGNFALFPTITADTFGAGNVGLNYPLVFLAYGVGGIAGPIMGGKLGDLGNFPLAFTVCGIACIVAAAFISLTKPVSEDEAEDEEDTETGPEATK